MKINVLIIIALAGMISCQNTDKKLPATPAVKDKRLLDSANYSSIRWIDSLVDLGAIPSGQKTQVKFKFKNTGNKPLFVVEAKPGCGCTVADYPKEAIAPGKEGVITAEYNVTANTTGGFRKNIRVTTNTLNQTDHIYFFGKIRKEGDTTAENSEKKAALDSMRIERNKQGQTLKLK